MIRILFAACFLFISPLISAQVEWDDLRFHSAAERHLFVDLEAGRMDYLGLLIHSYDSVPTSLLNEARQKIDQTVNEIKQSGILEKSAKRQSKYIYKLVHDRFFVKYELTNQFRRVFEGGRFNCVSATAVYALIFQDLGLPYDIIAIPGHVYIVAWPDSDPWVVETTDPKNGIYQISERDKENYVKVLVNAKMIDPAEYDGLSGSQIYNKLMGNKQEVIDLRGLVGIQYANYALYKIDERDFESALNYIEKAMWLYKSKDYAQYANLIRAMYLEDVTDYNNRFIDVLADWGNDTLNVENNTAVMGSYEHLLNEKLINSNDWTEFERLSNRLESQLIDSSLNATFHAYYHYEFGRVAIMNGKMDVAYNQLDTALAYEPNNHQLHTMFLQVMNSRFKQMENGEQMLAFMDEVATKHPVFASQEIFQTVKAAVYLQMAYAEATQQNLTNTMSFIEEFEKTIQNGNAQLLETSLVSAVYSEALGMYFMRGNKTKARELADRGLSYAPGSIELRNRKLMLR